MAKKDDDEQEVERHKAGATGMPHAQTHAQRHSTDEPSGSVPGGSHPAPGPIDIPAGEAHSSHGSGSSRHAGSHDPNETDVDQAHAVGPVGGVAHGHDPDNPKGLTDEHELKKDQAERSKQAKEVAKEAADDKKADEKEAAAEKKADVAAEKADEKAAERSKR